MVLFGQPTNESGKLANRLLRNLATPLFVKVLSIDDIDESKEFQLNRTSIVLFDSIQQFKKCAPKIRWLQDPGTRHKHIVSAPELLENDILDFKDGFKLDHVIFLTNETQKSVDLSASFMFTAAACSKNQPRTFNRFNGTWNNSILFPSKYDDMHGCHLTMGAFSYDIAPDFFPSLTRCSNFELDVEDSDNWTDLASKDFYRLFVSYHDFLENKIVSEPFIFTKYAFYVPDGEPYGQFEKMWMMFEPEVWLGICCTLLFWAVAIQVINRSSQTVQHFVYGRDINTPTMNLFDIFLNGGKYKVPKRNFARFILMLFVYWCLVVRVCYQSKLFEFLQSDFRKE